MCTAATYQTKDFYFGRTLDYEFSYGDEVTIMPRNYEITFRHMGVVKSHYAMIGMAYVTDDYPLYYDAINEKGVGMAGLNFVGNAAYAEVVGNKDNVAQFEFIPWILSQCASVQEARDLLAKMNLVGTPYNEQLPAAQLHWMIADAKECIVVESMADGMHIHDNPTGVMTNNPPFDMQMFLLNQYMGLSEKQPENHFSKELPLQTYSRGMGALGLPLISSGVVAKSVKENTRLQSIRPAAMQQRESIIIRLMIITRLQEWICTERIWMGLRL